jgi:hypothetical protein
MGLSFREGSKKVVALLQRPEWDESVHISGHRVRGREAGRLLRTAPRGRDGTGKDVIETLRTVQESLDRFEAAVRANPARSLAVIRTEVETGLERLEKRLGDVDLLEWILDTPEELDLLLMSRSTILDGFEWLEDLHVGTGEFRRRLDAFDAAVKAIRPSLNFASAGFEA